MIFNESVQHTLTVGQVVGLQQVLNDGGITPLSVSTSGIDIEGGSDALSVGSGGSGLVTVGLVHELEVGQEVSLGGDSNIEVAENLTVSQAFTGYNSEQNLNGLTESW